MSDVILPLLPCSSMCISGQTGSGKTRFVYRLLSDVTKMYREDPPDRIMYCYGIHQPLFDDMEVEIPNLEMKHGLPTPEEIEEFTKDHRRFVSATFEKPGNGIAFYSRLSPPSTKRCVYDAEFVPKRLQITYHCS